MPKRRRLSPTDLADLSAKAQAARRAVAVALRRPKTYRSAVKELLWTGINVAMYPAGLVSEALEPNAGPGSLRGRFSTQLPLRYTEPEAAATPIVMLHGYFHNRTAFLVFRRALRRLGFQHIDSMNYNVIGHAVPELAAQLSQHVDRVLAQTGATRVHLIGHSLGGLVARYYIQELGGHATVHTCVTLGTPHGGTYAAWVGRGRAARDLRPGSPLLEQLAAGAREMPVRFVSYYSNLDGLVIPAASAKLTDPALKARNVLVRDLGHMSLLISTDVIRSVGETLAHLEGPTAPSEATVTPLPKRARSRNANGRRVTGA